MKLGVVSMAVFICMIQVVTATTRYVDANSSHPVSPYTSWATAAVNIQDAINASAGNDTIWVNDGTYQFGSVNSHGMSRINTLGKPLTIQSVNGPDVTAIKGSTNSSSLIRCAYLTSGAVLSGFTLTNGGALVGGGGVYCETLGCIVTNCVIVANFDENVYGGGGANGGTLLGCILTNNMAGSKGGGACSNTLINCTLGFNRAGNGGGAYGSALTNCLLVGNVSTTPSGPTVGGGGAAYSFLENCSVSNNAATNNGGGLFLSIASDSLITGNWSAGGYGGGAYLTLGFALNNCLVQGNYSYSGGGGACGNSFGNSGSLNDCQIIGNSVGSGSGSGGGVVYAVLNNCLVTGNTARNGAGAAYIIGNNCTIAGNLAVGSGVGAGAYFATLNNSIIYDNQAVTNADAFGSALTNCCTSLLNNSAAVANSFTNDPAFVDPNGDFHLQSDSPCINAGNNAFTTATNDLDGNPRIVGGTVDVGAYEYQSPASVISYAWLEQYGLATDGSDDFVDTDGDGMNNWQEWIAGTDPTDPASLLEMYAATPTNNFLSVKVSWQSVAGKKYFIQRSADLSTFSIIQSNIIGQAGTTVYTDTSATNSKHFFYQAGVQNP